MRQSWRFNLLRCEARMLQGDLATMSLADLLQWADAISATGVLTLERGPLRVWCRVERRHVVRVQAPEVRPVSQPGIAVAAEGIAPLDLTVLALEQLYDQFLDVGDRFTFDPDVPDPDEGLPLRVPLQKLVMEGLRLLDEWPRLRATFPADQARLKRTSGEPPSELPLTAVLRAVLSCAERELTLSQARMLLGVSRPALLRAVEELQTASLIEVTPAPNGIDLMTQLVDQGAALIRARQFDEAQHVLRALLLTDPTAARVKQLLREAELMHVQALRVELPLDALVLEGHPIEPSAPPLPSDEREVMSHVNDRRDVATLVTVSRLRELETLKALRRLWRQGLLQLHRQ